MSAFWVAIHEKSVCNSVSLFAQRSKYAKSFVSNKWEILCLIGKMVSGVMKEHWNVNQIMGS